MQIRCLKVPPQTRLIFSSCAPPTWSAGYGLRRGSAAGLRSLTIADCARLHANRRLKIHDVIVRARQREVLSFWYFAFIDSGRTIYIGVTGIGLAKEI
jgi:hypothetical protein